MAFPWLWILGAGAVAGAGAWFLTQKKEGAKAALPPYVPPAPAPAPLPQPTPPPIIILPMPPAPTPSEAKPIAPPMPTPPSSTVTSPTGSTIQILQGQPGPGGVPVTMQIMTVATQTDPLNLRDQPNGKVIGQLPKGSQFAVSMISNDGAWAYGKSQATGQSGWASKQFLAGTYGAATETFRSAGYYGDGLSETGAEQKPGHGGLYTMGFKTLMRHTMAKHPRAPGVVAKSKG